MCPSGQINESRCIELLQKHDNDAFDCLIDKYNKGLYNLAYSITESYDDSIECVQESFLRLIKNISVKSFSSLPSIYNYLYRIVWNEALTILRRRKTRREGPLFDDNIIGKSDNPEQQALHDERLSKLENAITSLPEQQENTFRMHYYDKLTLKEISALINIPESMVEDILIEARDNLSNNLKGYFNG